ncbi:MAG: hypothetical protein ABI597_10725 [Gammaproteobacteria bacterium]
MSVDAIRQPQKQSSILSKISANLFWFTIYVVGIAAAIYLPQLCMSYVLNGL